MGTHQILKRAAATIESLEPRLLLSGGRGGLRIPVNDLAPASEASYIYTTLSGPAGATYVEANGISDSTVVGYYVGSDQNGHGFIYDGSTYTTLNDPNAPTVQGTTATGISGSNVVGYYYDSNAVIHGFIYDESSGAYFTLNDPNAGQDANQGTFAQAISGSTIVGYYDQSNGVVHGFTYNATTGIYTTLNDPDAGQAANQGTFATGISGSDIVGYYYDSTSVSHGFMYNGGTFVSLDDPAAIETRAIGLSGTTVVGWYYDSSAVIHGFIYDGAYATLDDPAGSATHATGISGSTSGSTVVGYYTNGSGAIQGFLAIPGVSSPPGNISGVVFNDRNGDGIQERHDSGLSGITITLQQLKHGKPHGRALTTTTNSEGDYSFTGVAAATYRVTQTLPRRYILTLPKAGSYTITLAAGQTSSGNNFGDEKKTRPSAAAISRGRSRYFLKAIDQRESQDPFGFVDNQLVHGLRFCWRICDSTSAITRSISARV